MAESEEELKGLLMKVKEESEKAGLKLNILKTKIMASGPLTSWQTDGEKMETVTDFIFLDSKITTDSDCSHEVKTLAPPKKCYDKSSSVLSLSCSLTLCSAMNCSMPGFPVYHQLSELTQIHVHRLGDVIQTPHPLSALLLLPSIFPSIRVFFSESVLHITWPKY